MKITNPIRNCPFCGGKAEKSFYEGLRFVKCTECGAEGQKFDVRQTKGYTYNVAINKWNNRVKLGPQDLPFMEGYMSNQNDLELINDSEEYFEQISVEEFNEKK